MLQRTDVLPLGVKETLRLDDPQLFDKVFTRLSQGSRVELLNRGNTSGPIRHETLSMIGTSLVIRPSNYYDGGWRIANEKTLHGWLELWKSYVTDGKGNFNRGPRGGLQYYLNVRRTERPPLLGHRR